MTEWEELRGYVGVSEQDLSLLRGFWPLVEPRVDRIVAHFYERVWQSPGARGVLEDQQQIERLERTMKVWLRELLLGPHDAAYVERRRRIGWRHVQVGLEARYMHAAMQVMADDLQQIAYGSLSPEEQQAVCTSLHRVMSLDLAIMTGGYVTTRERASFESLQQLLVTHLRTMVVLIDREDHVVMATRSTSRWLGGVSILGRRWEEVLPPDLVAAASLEQVVRSTIREGQSRSLPRIDIRTEGGAVRSYRVDVVPTHHPLAAAVVEIEELTETVDLEGRLRRSEALAQLGSLSAAVAHELRNPLAGISGAIQVISRSVPKDAPYAPVMQRVEREIKRLDELVTDLLAFARPGAVRLQPVDLADPVSAAVEWVREDHPDVAVTVEGSGAAQADANLVQQILLNLLQNAAQAMEGRGRILVRLEGSRVSVCDDGPGIPKEMGERVFEPFTTTKVRGTGLGLAICTRSALAMGGSLSLGRGPLPGACFVLELRPPVHG